MAGENLNFSNSLDQWIDLARIKHRGKMNENCQLPTANCQLPTANCQLPTANCQLPTKSGFTLVELSILIVIIGLLIGGILVGQNMIQSAKISNFTKQNSQVLIAIRNFHSKYKGLPGDSAFFGGNGNLYLEDGSGNTLGEDCSGEYGCNMPSWYFTGENSNFWVNLEAAGFNYGGSFTATLPASGVPSISSQNPNLPKLSLDKDGGLMAAACGSSNNCLYFRDFSSQDMQNSDPGGLCTSGPALTALTAMAIDKKFDNGFADSGLISQFGGAHCSSSSAGADFPYSNCNTNEAYNVDNSDVACVITTAFFGRNGFFEINF